MHTGPMPESAGTFTYCFARLFECRRCRSKSVVVTAWESNCGGYEDQKNECLKCGDVWWTEGADA